MLKKRTFFWVGIPLCLLIIFYWGYHLYHKPHQSAAGETAAFTIDADSLVRSYQADEQGCDKKYLGKVIEVTGTIAEIQHTPQSEIWILSAPSGNGGGVNCQLFAGEKTPDPHPKPGDKVILKGRCTGFLMDVNLADCVVSK
jgi:hypothetical protein